MKPRRTAVLATLVAVFVAACQPGDLPARGQTPDPTAAPASPVDAGAGQTLTPDVAAAPATPTLDVAQLQLTVARPAGYATAEAGSGDSVAGELPVHTGGDANDTVHVEQMAAGESRSARIDNVFEAHNWLFEGRAGQTVTISVIGAGSADPAARLIGPDGETLMYQQDVLGEANTNVQIDATLPADGLYTVRVDLWVPGEYMVIVGP